MKIKLLIVLWVCSFLEAAGAQDCTREKRALEEGIAYFNDEQFLLASQVFSQLRLFGSEACDYSFEASYFQSAAYLELEDVRAFELSLQKLTALARNSTQVEATKLLRAYAYDEPILNGVREDLRRRWSLWNKRSDLALESLGIHEQDSALRAYQRAAHTKIPWIAGALSALLPGAGQVYTGAYQSAALSFLFNALLLGTTLEFHRQHLDSAAVTSGVLFSMTYLGNIASAVQGAAQLNESRSQQELSDLRRSLLPELRF